MTELGPFIKSNIYGVPFVLEKRSELYIEIAAFITFWGVMAASATYFLRSRRDIFSSKGRLIFVLFIWSLPVTVFGLVFLGADTERWLAVTPIFWMMLVVLNWHSRTYLTTFKARLIEAGLWGLVLLVLLHNASLAIIPQSNPDNNHFLQTAKYLDSHISERDLVMLWGHDNVFTGGHLSYFFSKKARHLRMVGGTQSDHAKNNITALVNSTWENGGRVFVIGRLFLPKDLPESGYPENDQRVDRKELGKVLSRWERTQAFIYKKDIYWELENNVLE